MLRTGRPATIAGSASGPSTRNHCRMAEEAAPDCSVSNDVSSTTNNTPSLASRRLCELCLSMVFMAYLDLLQPRCQIALPCFCVNSERRRMWARSAPLNRGERGVYLSWTVVVDRQYTSFGADASPGQQILAFAPYP